VTENTKTFFQEMLEHTEVVEIPSFPRPFNSVKSQHPKNHLNISTPREKALDEALDFIETNAGKPASYISLNEEWEKNHISDLVYFFHKLRLYRCAHQKCTFIFEGCNKTDSSLIKYLIDQAIESLEGRLYQNFYEVKEVEGKDHKVAAPKVKVEVDRDDIEAVMGLLYFDFHSESKDIWETQANNIANIVITESINQYKSSGRQGGIQAAKNRAHIRKQVQNKVKDAIQKQFTWNDASQTGKSITDRFWSEIKNAIDGGNEWQGISNSDLLQGKIGRQTVYDAVMETAPR